MISIVLYGRNDNYGYNLHKRAALSFNCMAEVLQEEGDEILFVDYNTPDDFPTFPEAIQDTLSQRARQRLRIFRVRPRIHRRFSSKTRLVALEPISRNIALRRSNPANRWILSTNTDMIFVPQSAASLNEIARDLPAGFYHAPRIEIPETLWEGLDRSNAREAIETVRDWGSALHINEIVLGSPVILYDAPGDFQLMQRSDLFEIQGFHEEMLLGWHVDSNIAKRLTMLRGKVSDLGKEIYGYHCDHGRQVTLMHSHSRTENDWRRFIEGVERPDIPEQAQSWGCANDEIEEIRLTGQSASTYVTALKRQIGERQSLPPVVAYIGENYDKTDYDPRHVLPYLADMFVCCEKQTNLGWFGTRREMLARFSGFWKELGFTGDILVDGSLVREAGLATAPQIIETSMDAILSKADAFVFDFGPVPGGEEGLAGVPTITANGMNRAFLRVVMAEQNATSNERSPRRVIGVNAINSVFESSVTAHVGAAHAPFSARMRNGFVLPPMKGEVDWTSRLQAGHAGVREGSLIRSRVNMSGPVIYGPYRHLFAGTYRFKMKLGGNAPHDLSPDVAIAVLEVISQRNYLGHRIITPSDLAKGEIELDVDVTEQQSISPGFSIQTLLRTLSPVHIVCSALTCERVSASRPNDFVASRALTAKEWLLLLWTGPDAIRRNGQILYTSTKPGIVFYGPYFGLPEGKYEVNFELTPIAAYLPRQAVISGYWDSVRRVIRHRLSRFWEEPIGQLQALVRTIRVRWNGLWGEIEQANVLRMGNAVCRFQAISLENELTARVLSDGESRSKTQLSLFFTVTALQAADPNFALELRLLAYTKLPFAITSVTVQPQAKLTQDKKPSTLPSG